MSKTERQHIDDFRHEQSQIEFVNRLLNNPNSVKYPAIVEDLRALKRESEENMEAIRKLLKKKKGEI